MSGIGPSFLGFAQAIDLFTTDGEGKEEEEEGDGQ